MNDEMVFTEWLHGVDILRPSRIIKMSDSLSEGRNAFLNGHEAIISNEKYAELMKTFRKNMDEHIRQRMWSESEDVPCPKPDPEHEEMCGSELWGAF